MTSRAAQLHCTYPGCAATLIVDARHIANLTAGGGWDCGDHDLAEVCS